MSLLVRRRGKGEVNDGFVDYRIATLDCGYCTDIKIYRMFAKTLYLMGFTVCCMSSWAKCGGSKCWIR